MATNTITVEIEKKRVYAYLTMTNYGWASDEDDDPWDLIPNPSGNKCVLVYRFPLNQLEGLEEHTRAYFAKHYEYIEWESLGQAMGGFLSGLIFPWEKLEYLLKKGGCTAKRISCKTVPI